jgi:hypothetical protein
MRTWKLNTAESSTLFLFCTLIGFYLTLQSYESNDTDIIPAALCVCIIIIFLQLWHKFWPCNSTCVVTWKRKARQRLGHGGALLVHSSGTTKSRDKSQLITLLSLDACMCHHSQHMGSSRFRCIMLRGKKCITGIWNCSEHYSMPLFLFSWSYTWEI